MEDTIKITKTCQHLRVYTWTKKGEYACRDCGAILKKVGLSANTSIEKTDWFAISLAGGGLDTMVHHIPEKYIDDIDAVSDVFIDCYKDFMAERGKGCLHIED